VAGLLFVFITEEKQHVKNVVDRKYVNTGKENHIVKSVAGLLFVFITNTRQHVKSVAGHKYAFTIKKNLIVNNAVEMHYVNLHGAKLVV
jgi:hypothetical protein